MLTLLVLLKDGHLKCQINFKLSVRFITTTTPDPRCFISSLGHSMTLRFLINNEIIYSFKLVVILACA